MAAEIILARNVDVIKDEYVQVMAGSHYAIRGNEKEVKHLIKIIQEARSGSADACIELIEYGKALRD